MQARPFLEAIRTERVDVKSETADCTHCRKLRCISGSSSVDDVLHRYAFVAQVLSMDHLAWVSSS
jgi:hypothetical protein